MSSSDTHSADSLDAPCVACDLANIGVAVVLVLFLLKKYFSGTNNSAKRNLKDQVIILTGANTGIGLETARDLVQNGAKLIVACRDVTRGRKAEEELNALVPNSSTFLQLNLADLSSVRLFVNEFKSKFDRLDVLINNAGVMHPPTRELTKDGFELQIGTNHLGHFLLTNLLMDSLKKSEQFRVVTVSSMAHMQGGIDIDDLNFERRPYGIINSYAQSKLANILFTQLLQKRIQEQKLNGVAVCLHPGVVRTELTRYYEKGIIGLLFKVVHPIYYVFSKSCKEGAQTTLYCVHEKFEKLQAGAYYSDCKVKATSNKQITAENAEKLWTVSTKLVKL